MFSTKSKIRRRQVTLRSDDVLYRRWHIPFATEPPSLLQEMRGPYIVRGTQVTESEGHPWADKGYKGVDIGGPFRTEKLFMEDERGESLPSPMYSFDGKYNWRHKFHGPIYVRDPNNIEAYPPSPALPDNMSDLAPWGTKAIALVKPTNSVAEVSVALGELMREGLPSVIGAKAWQTRLRDIRASGDEYLNVAFGWLPLINDVGDVAKAITESEKILSQYERDAGRLVRRRYEFPIVKENTGPTVYINNQFPYLGTYGYMNAELIYAWCPNPASFGRPVYLETSTEIRRWFSGAFTYNLPADYNSRNAVKRAASRADKLFGIELTPETLWNLTPWSWAADWAFNFGDVLANVSDFATDGLVLPYGYIMEERTIKYTWTMPDVRFKGYEARNLTQVHTRVIKRRLPATPFGFGLTFDGLSSRQKWILAALGITKVR